MSTKEYLVQSIVSQMVIYLMDEFRWDMITAMKAIYHSELFRKLDDAEIGLYTQSPKYVYCYLKKELLTGKYIWGDILIWKQSMKYLILYILIVTNLHNNFIYNKHHWKCIVRFQGHADGCKLLMYRKHPKHVMEKSPAFRKVALRFLRFCST